MHDAINDLGLFRGPAFDVFHIQRKDILSWLRAYKGKYCNLMNSTGRLKHDEMSGTCSTHRRDNRGVATI